MNTWQGSDWGKMKMEKKVKERISIVLGDITTAEVDAIVNAANNELMLGGGVAGAIGRKGGPEIQRECDGIGPIQVGQAAVTGGGKLKCRHVIHAASMRLGGMATAETVRNAVRSSFFKASENDVETVALPAVGAGIAGFPVRRCAEIMMNEAAQALRRKAVQQVRFYLFDKNAYDAFMEAYRAIGD